MIQCTRGLAEPPPHTCPRPECLPAGTYDHRVILRCTGKLLAVIGPGRAAVPDLPPSPEDWYANLLWLAGRKCLLITHSATLFTILQPDVRAADLRDTHRLVSGMIARELAAEDLPPSTFGDLGSPDLILARTADRSVLGCMNDMAHRCEHAMTGGGGGLAQADIPALNHALRRNINSARSYQRPIDLARSAPRTAR